MIIGARPDGKARRRVQDEYAHGRHCDFAGRQPSRETGTANSGVQRRPFSSATIAARRVAAYSPVGIASTLNSAAAIVRRA